jgi:hypothetical protein
MRDEDGCCFGGGRVGLVVWWLIREHEALRAIRIQNIETASGIVDGLDMSTSTSASRTSDVNHTTILCLHVSSPANILHPIICTQFHCSSTSAALPSSPAGQRALHTVRAGLMRHLPTDR